MTFHIINNETLSRTYNNWIKKKKIDLYKKKLRVYLLYYLLVLITSKVLKVDV